MDFKKKCINFKKNAKEFGYDLKLTHVQELLSKYEGYENRHALLSSLKEKKNKVKEKWYYFDVHVFYGRDEGYSVGIRSKKNWKIGGAVDQDGILEWIEKKELMDKGDLSCVDYVNEISEEDWKWLTSYNDEKIECYHCKQLYDKERIVKTETTRTDIICDTCYDNEVKVYISTDDSYFDYVETYLSEEYLNWSMDNDLDMIDNLVNGFYGPDYHTDNILYNAKTPETKRILKYVEYQNESPNKEVSTGYSVVVDEKSFQKWKNKNLSKLKRKGLVS